MPLVINTFEEMKEAYLMQRMATAKATLELNGAVTVSADAGADASGTLVQQVTHLLTSYAGMPTLAECGRAPELRGAYKQGATFGVALIVGEMILKQVKQIASQFPLAHLSLLIILLSELEPGIDPLDILAGHTTFELIGSEDEQRQQTLDLLAPLAAALVGVASIYKLVETDGALNCTVTPLGLRVALHLLDAHQFVNVMIEAHARFRKAKTH